MGVPDTGCLVENARSDITEAVRTAVRAGEPKVTLELRVPEAYEPDPRFGRRFTSGLTLQVAYNTPPPAPVDLRTGPWNDACDTKSPGTYMPFSHKLTATIAEDPDGLQDKLTAKVVIWPVSDPAKREERTVPRTSSSVTFWMSSPVEHEQTYAYTFQSDDGTDTSPLAGPCYFTMDTVGPGRPTATSAEYPNTDKPTGDVGMPGQFTFSANGTDDVAGFYWGTSWDTMTFVPADRLGGTATVTFTPTRSGVQSFDYQSADRAGGRSGVYSHYFWVRESRPNVRSDYSDIVPRGGIGIPGKFEFERTQQTDVREYLYQFNDEPEQTVAAKADETAEITWTPTRGGPNTLKVRGKEASGAIGATRVYQFTVATAPTVYLEYGAIVGRESTAQLLPGMPNVVEYEYWFDEGAHKTVPADSAGKATFQWVPSGDMWDLNVRSKAADGFVSDVWSERAYFDRATPTVSHSGGGIPGRPTVFTTSTRMPNPTEYRWRIEGRSDSGSKSADGTVSGQATYTFIVNYE